MIPPPSPPSRLLALALLLFASILSAAPAPASPSTQPAELPPDLLRTLYRDALGPSYRDADFPSLLSAHRLLESFFSAPTPESRAAALARLSALHLDPALAGRLCSIDLHWPDLSPGVYYVNEPFRSGHARYFLGVPAGYSRSRAVPLAIFLPQADAFLANPRPGPDDVVRIYQAWIDDQMQRHPGLAVLMPLLNLDELWGPSQPGIDSVILPLLHVPSRLHIDPARVYLVGHGMSAHAAWNIGLLYPTYFAAFDILAGAATQDDQRLRLPNLRNTLPVVWHDTDDLVLPVSRTRLLVNALRAVKIDVVYNETRGLGHVPPEKIADDNLATALSRTRQLYPRHVTLQSNRPGFMRVDWLEILQPLDPGDDTALLPRHGSGKIHITKNASRADAEITSPSQIRILTDNVARLRIYLSPEMVDLSQPVTITANSRPPITLRPTPSLESRLSDELALGRGWRSFPAFLDLDLTAPPK